MLNLQKGRECYHKIKFFQYHPDCNELAALCENRCQPLHASNGAVYSLPIASVQDKHQKIKGKLVSTLKGYTDHFKKRYEEIIESFHKKSAEILKEMEKELLGELMKCINVSRDVLEKIENERMDRLKCTEIYSFYSDEEYEDKLKGIQLGHIYEKHYHRFLQTYKNFSWEGSPEKNSINKAGQQQANAESIDKSTNSNGSTVEDKLKAQLNKIRQRNALLEEELRELKGRSQRKQRRLERKSWTIAIVKSKRKTKKIAKGLADALLPLPEEQRIPVMTILQQQEGTPNQRQLVDAEDSQDIFQLQARQRK